MKLQFPKQSSRIILLPENTISRAKKKSRKTSISGSGLDLLLVRNGLKAVRMSGSAASVDSWTHS